MRKSSATTFLAALLIMGAGSAFADDGTQPVNINLSAFSSGVKSIAVRAKSGDRLAETDLVMVGNALAYVPTGF